MNSRTKNVGTGSSKHVLAGDDMMMRHTSDSEHGRKYDSDDGAELSTAGAGCPAVAAIAPFTF